MKLWKRIGTMAMAGALTMGMLAGCGGSGSSGTSSKSSSGSESSSKSASASGEGFEIGYVNLADTDVFCMARETALSAVLDGTDYNVSFADGNNDNQKQIDQTNAFLAKGVDTLILVPADSDAITPAITAANSAGTPVICLGIKANGGDFIFVGSENYDAGHIQGEYMAEVLPENANVLYCAGTAGLQHSSERREGFLAALDEAGRDDVTVLADQDGDYVKDEAMRICDAWIQTYADGNGGVTFDAIVCANDQMALGCVESLKGAGLLTTAGEILITGVDGSDDGLKAVSDGYMAQTVLQDANGQAEAAYEVLQQIRNGEETDAEVIVPFQSITKDNIADYM